MSSSRRKDNSHHNLLPVRLDEELHERERERLRVTSMSLDPLIFTDGSETVPIPDPRRHDRRVGHSAGEVLMVRRGPLLDKHKGRTVEVLSE
jgi:hypothetical protein